MSVSPVTTERKIFSSASARLPVAPKERSYAALVKRILADKSGHATWRELELLDQASERDPAAAKAMRGLEARYVAAQFRPGFSDLKSTVSALDSACGSEQRKCWRDLFGRHGRDSILPLLRESRRANGCRVLGLPSRFGRVLAPASRGSLERLEDWDRLVERSVRRRVYSGSLDPRLEEYRRLYQAYEEVKTGRYHGRVAERSLYADMKELEEKLLPEQIREAQEEVRERALRQDKSAAGAESTVRSFLGSISRLPSRTRESHLFDELASVAVRSPRELLYYSRMIAQEAQRGPRSLRDGLMSDFQSALDRVQKAHPDSSDAPNRNEALESLLRNLVRSASPQADAARAKDDDLKLFRGGLTVNGYLKNYTYL